MAPYETAFVELDERGRANLKKLAGDQRQYLATTGSDGTIVLEPAKIVTEAQRRFEASPDVVEALRSAMTDPDQGQRYVPGQRGRDRG